MSGAELRVGLAHDYCTQRGGAERVVTALTRIYPGAPLFTSLYRARATFAELSDVDVRTSSLQNIPFLSADPRVAVPVLGRVWRNFDLDGLDVVLASSSGWAHRIVEAAPATPVVVYCHNPPRWLYQRDAYFSSQGLRRAAVPLLDSLSRSDGRAACRAAVYLANSTNVAERIRDVYGITAEILHPPVTLDPSGDMEPMAGLVPGEFWLTVARSRGYKNVALLERAFTDFGLGVLCVVGSTSAGGSEVESRMIHRPGVVTEAELRWLYAHARGLISLSREDFGLTPLEANSFGTPVAVIRDGGFLDSTVEGLSGVFVEERTVEAVVEAVRGFPDFDPVAVQNHAARFSVEAFSARLRRVVSEAARNA